MDYKQLGAFVEEKAVSGITGVPSLRLSPEDIKVARVKLLPARLEKPTEGQAFAVHYIPNRGYVICTEKMTVVDEDYPAKPCEACKVLKGADSAVQTQSKAKYRIVIPLFVLKTASVQTGTAVKIEEPMFFSQSINTGFAKDFIELVTQHPEYLQLNNTVTLKITVERENGFPRYYFEVDTSPENAFNEKLYDDKIMDFYRTYKAIDLFREATDDDLAALNPEGFIPPKKSANNTSNAPVQQPNVEDDNGLDDIDLSNI